VIGERIRDKFAASRKKGMWMGGLGALGYDVKDRKLAVNEAEAKKVRMIFERFVKIGSATLRRLARVALLSWVHRRLRRCIYADFGGGRDRPRGSRVGASRAHDDFLSH